MDRFNELRATLIARGQEEKRAQEEKRRSAFRLPRLVVIDKFLWPVCIICFALLAASIPGTALFVNLLKQHKVEVIGPILASEPVTRPPDPPIEPPITADTSEPVKTNQSGTGDASTNTAQPLSATAQPLSATAQPPSTTARPLSTEEIRLLIRRADALVATADLGSARLFYERAAAAGDAQAAIKLGATYDPLFLSQAGLRFVRADPKAAAHWYARARDLGAVEQAEFPRKNTQGN
jgi:hypothetical protein